MNVKRSTADFESDPSKGIVYTCSDIVTFCLDLAESVMGATWLKTNILDIGCGYGQFIGQVTKRAVKQAVAENLQYTEFIKSFSQRVRGIEVRPDTAEAAARVVASEICGRFGDRDSNAMLNEVVRVGDFLQWDSDLEAYNLIVGNIPYVRYSKIPDLPQVESREELKKRFELFEGRSDYSIPFLERVFELLGPNGTAVLICSNRFTRAEYGKRIRKKFESSDVSVHEIDLNGLSAFESEVSVYASVFVVSRSLERDFKYIRLHSVDGEVLDAVAELFPDRVGEHDAAEVMDRMWEEGAHGAPWGRSGSTVRSILERLVRECRSVEEAGFRVRKGPATGANDVFIGPREKFAFSDSSADEFLVPVYVTKANGRGPKSVENREFILSVFAERTGELIKFDEFPTDVQEYLQKHRDVLRKRYIVDVLGYEWWRTIDKFDPAERKNTKILVPDLQMGDAVVIDEGEHLPSHSTVSISCEDELALRGLARVLQSVIAEEFRFLHSPDMGPRSPRASAKVLKRLPVPNQEALIDLGRGGESSCDVLEAFGLKGEDRKSILGRQREQRF